MSGASGQLPIDGRHRVGVLARVVRVVASQRLRDQRGGGGRRRGQRVCSRTHVVRQRYLRHLSVQTRRVIAALVIVIVAMRVVVRCGRGSVQTDIYHNHAFSSASRRASSFSLTAGSSHTARESELLELRLRPLCLDFGKFVFNKLM